MPSRTRLASLACALAVGCVVTGAHAAPVHAEKSLGETLRGGAKEAYVSAELLFNNGDFRGAIAKYQQAYDLSKDARLLFDMALAEKNLRAYARMQRLLERYEHEAAATISADDRASVDAALAAIKNLVGVVTITTNVPGASIAIDDDPVGTTPLAEPVAVDLGRHTVTARKEGYETASLTMNVVGGARTTQALTLAAQVHAGHLLVTAEPGSVILIDGRITAKERFDDQLPAGAHEVSVTAPGKAAYKAEVDLRERETRTLQVTLPDERHGIGAGWWVAGGVVAAAGLGVGAYFLFKPQDRVEPVPQAPLFNTSLSSWGSR
jgi:hypothetical protein